jgi:arginyl-tRNA synthetase
MIEEQLKIAITKVLAELGIVGVSFVLEHPADMAHGDFATNAAMVAAKKADKNPRTLAEEIVAKLKAQNNTDVIAIDIAGPGFINFKIAPTVFDKELSSALSSGENWGWNANLKGKKVMVEYTDPNPFKEFHIGHLMSNTIGESISRLIEASGAETKRACYQGDVGLHVAKAIWGINKEKILSHDIVLGKLANAYAFGSQSYEDAKEGSEIQKEIIEINRKIYNRSDPKINEMYEQGRKISLEYFETLYKRLGTAHGDEKAFNYYFFESATGEFGKKVVESHPEIFEKSDGAIVYKGDEAKGLHTRVFINKEGLPTYEAKELGLAQIKYDTFPYDTSIVITGNEVNDYFKVLLDAMQKVFPELAQKTEHYSHGMLRLPTGKMSSRTGDVITATWLLDEAKANIMKNVSDALEPIAEAAAVAAIKYSILRQSKGKDIIFDFAQSLSFEGDSGPYLQYTHARTCSILEKAGGAAVLVEHAHKDHGVLQKLLVRFPEVVRRAGEEREPHHVANYLIEVAREFNSFYGNTTILDGTSDQSYKLALTKAVGMTLKNGLWLLGIVAPDKM